MKLGQQSRDLAAKLAAASFDFYEFLLPPGEKYPREFVTDVERRAFDVEVARRAALDVAAREQMLRERLKEWKPWTWDVIFLQAPHLEAELTPAQKTQWEQAKAERREREAARERANRLVAFPDSKT